MKDRYQGHILAIKLFRDSFTVVVGSLLKTIFWVGGYLSEQFKPVVLLLIPFALLFAQLQARLGVRPVDVGKELLVTVEVDPQRQPGTPDVALDLPDGVAQARPAVREPSLHRVVFTVVPRQPGQHELRFRIGSEVQVKSLHAGNLAGYPALSSVRSNSFMDALESPAEPGFSPTSAFQRIALVYPVRPLPFLGLDLSFHSEFGLMLVFLALTIVAAFALKDLFGVTI
jgi:hypothetical protein